MNVWIVNHYAVAPGSSGGTWHYDLARELTKQGCRVTISGKPGGSSCCSTKPAIM